MQLRCLSGALGDLRGSPSGNLFVSEMCGGGLHVLDFTLDDEPAPPDPAPSTGSTSPYPLNPTSNSGLAPTELRAELEAAGSVTLEIYDVAGRLVRTLVSGEEREAGLSTWVWDGRSDSGARADAGVYYARLAQGRRAIYQKVVRVG
ncbi:MAG: FlgD immunoglobulin-like domain containing protein [Candidatus Eisenbacteria bacterium]